jgi:predicted O-methyltransferase YrrM
MGSVLQEILKTGFADGISVPLHSQIRKADGKFLQSIIRKIQPHVCLEVGLAFGISALFIREVLDPRSRYIAIDPFQHHYWHGIGLTNLRRAGYEVEFYEETSQAILPRLWANGLTIDFAFIDGMHTFDHALVDFFYIDRMLRVGGVVAIDDASWPSLHKLCRFILTNRAYRVYGFCHSTWRQTEREAARRAALSLLTVVPTWIKRHLKPEWQQPDELFGLTYGRLVLLTKQGEDGRRENFHQAF